MIGKKFGKNNLIMALNFLFVKKGKIYPSYVWKHNSNCETQVILLMILNGERWHYITVKKITCINKRNNVKASWWFFLSELPSFLRNRKQKWIS